MWRITDHLSGRRWEFDNKEDAVSLLSNFRVALGNTYPITTDFFDTNTGEYFYWNSDTP